MKSQFPYSEKEWFTLPLALRERWWKETEWSMKPPSAELLEAIKLALGEREEKHENK